MARLSGWQGTGITSSGLLQDAAAHLGEREAVLRRIEIVGASSELHGLENDAAYRRLGNGEVDDAPEFVVIHPALYRDDKTGGNAQFVQALYRLRSDTTEIGAA